MKWLRRWLLTKHENQELPEDILYKNVGDDRLTADLEHNEIILREIFVNCSDIVFSRIHSAGHIQWLIIYLESLVDTKILDDHVLKPLLSKRSNNDDSVYNGAEEPYEWIITTGTTAVTSELKDLVRSVLNGQAAILTAGNNMAMTVTVSGRAQRSLEEPSSEPVIRGPRDGFIENITTNKGLLRSRLKTACLKLESFTVGKHSQTEVVIAYLDGVAADSLVEEVRRRVTKIQVDGILDSGYIEGFIEDFPYSPFPQVHSTERPDVVAAGLLEGKAAILVDTTPFAMIVPMTFWAGMQASEDYYIRWPVATFIRWIRFVFLFIAIFAPPIYVAITTFHQEMIPTNLLLSIVGSREPVPFPAMIEALLMEIIFEALREAGIRLPKQIGQAISIVGALVIGQAAVQAGIISPPVVIIVSITGIAAFTIPRFTLSNGIRLLRFPILFLAGMLGLYGIMLGFLSILLHLAYLRSFGVPYFTPLAPLSIKDLKDVLIRAPIWSNNLRPQTTGSDNPVRIPPGQKPSSSQRKHPPEQK